MAKSYKKAKKGLSMIHVVIVCFVIYFGYTMFQQQLQINKYNSQISMYKSEISTKNQLIDYYNNQKGNVASDEYIEQVARESLGYVKPYEKIFIDANK